MNYKELILEYLKEKSKKRAIESMLSLHDSPKFINLELKVAKTNLNEYNFLDLYEIVYRFQ